MHICIIEISIEMHTNCIIYTCRLFACGQDTSVLISLKLFSKDYLGSQK